MLGLVLQCIQGGKCDQVRWPVYGFHNVFTGINASWIPNTYCNDPTDVAVDETYVYWTNNSGNSIGRAGLDGSNPDKDWITNLSEPIGIAVDQNYVYWANRGTNSVGRANLDGSEADGSWITGGNGPYGVAVDTNYVYWTNLFGCGSFAFSI